MFYRIKQIFLGFSKKERQFFLGASGVFIISSVLLTASIFYQTTEASPVKGGDYVEGIIGQPIAVNPLIAGDNDADRDLVTLLFASLFDLLEKYEFDETQKVWTLTLKSNLLWSDGKPLTSNDVLFTISVIQDPDARSPLFPTWQGVFAERLSEREIRLTLKNSYAFFLDNIKNLRIAPNHIFGNIPPQNFRLSDYNLQPVGSGPYKFVSFDKRRDGFISNYVLTANKNSAVGEPFIQNFTVKFFSNKTDAISAFNKKTVDGIGGLDNSDLKKLHVNHKVINVDRPRYYAIFFNQSTAPELKEAAVRAALLQATDKEKIVSQIFGKYGEVVRGPILPSVPGYDATIYSEETFSIEKATSTLEKAGWIIAEDGIREKTVSRNKVRLEFDIIVPEVKFLVDTANILREDWAKIGVSLNPVILKPSEVITNAVKPRNYKMIIFGNTLNNNPDVFSFWHSSQRFDPGLNLSLFNDRAVDTLLESIRQNLIEASRLQEISKLQKLIHDANPALFLYSPQYLYLTSESLGGFEIKSIALPANRFEDAEKWYLRTARIFK